MFRSVHTDPRLVVSKVKTEAIKTFLSNKSSNKPQSQIQKEDKERLSVLFK